MHGTGRRKCHFQMKLYILMAEASLNSSGETPVKVLPDACFVVYSKLIHEQEHQSEACLLDLGRQASDWWKSTMSRSRVQPSFRAWARAHFPKQRLVIEPILGPALFNLYVADLQKELHCPCYQYADDTTFFLHTKVADLRTCVNDMNRAISRLGKYSSDFNLALVTVK